MYRSFEIENFRCFRHLKAGPFARVNLIAGKNNVGKSAFLEALFLHAGAYNPGLLLNLNAFRGIEVVKVEFGGQAEEVWASAFHRFDVSRSVELTGEDRVSGRRVLRLSSVRPPEALELSLPAEEPLFAEEWGQVLMLEHERNGAVSRHYLIVDRRGLRVTPPPPPPPFPTIFLAARSRISPKVDAERFGKLDVKGEQDAILEVLRVVEPRLRRLAVIVIGEVPMLHGDVGMGRMIPLPLMGEGMARLASLVLAMANAPAGVVLVDEFENGLHHSVLPQVWEAVGEAARRFDIQLFATTHSLECVAAAHRAFSARDRYEFRLHRLELEADAIRMVSYDREALEGALEAGLEVR